MPRKQPFQMALSSRIKSLWSDSVGAWTRGSNPKTQRQSLNPAPRGAAPRGADPRQGLLHLHAQKKGCHQHISFSCILLVRIEPLPRQAACLRMETLNISEKWAEAGGAISDSMDLPSLPAHCWEGSAPQAERFLQERVKQASAKTN